jgi:hypothetical protein
MCSSLEDLQQQTVDGVLYLRDPLTHDRQYLSDAKPKKLKLKISKLESTKNIDIFSLVFRYKKVAF